MAGMGKRMRPHTLTVPKPLIPIAGIPIVERLVIEIQNICSKKIDEIAYIINDLEIDVQENLKRIAKSFGAKATIYKQDKPLGTAHAVYCAKESLEGNVIVAFADTLFKANFVLDSEADGVIWVKHVDDPRSFGVVKVNDQNVITEFIEHPKTPVSNLAIIGIYYFKQGEVLRDEIKYLIDNNIIANGEYQLTVALENMRNKNTKFKTASVDSWMDCGNKDATVKTNQRVLDSLNKDELISKSAEIRNSVVVDPCYIGENVIIENSVVGPHVSIGNDTKIYNSLLRNSIIQTNSVIETLSIENSMVGNYVQIKGEVSHINVGDYTQLS